MPNHSQTPTLVFLHFPSDRKVSSLFRRIRRALELREKQGTCELVMAEDSDPLAYLRHLERPERVRLLQLGPEVDPQAPPPPPEDLEAFEKCMRRYHQLELVIVTQAVPEWLLSSLFRSGVAAVWLTKGPHVTALTRFYRRLGRQKNLRASMPSRLTFTPWEPHFSASLSQTRPPGLYQRVDRKDALQWTLRPPVSIPLKEGFHLGRFLPRHWGFRLVLTALVIFAAFFAAVYLLPFMGDLF